jgi:AGCS family alanine or glycine:cation symporter
MTGMTIMVTGSWDKGLEGVDVTINAFQTGLPWSSSTGAFILMMSLAFFAFTTILGWDYYSERCLEYLTGKNLRAFRFLDGFTYWQFL